MKLIKRAAAFCMAAAMAMSLSATAFAAKGDTVTTGSLTVTGDQLKGKYVYAIRMFNAHVTEGTDTLGESYVFDSYTLEDECIPFFETEEMQTKLQEANGNLDLPEKPVADSNESYEKDLAAYNAAYSDAAVAYLQWLLEQEDQSLVPGFAEAAKDWAEEQKVFTQTYDSADSTKVIGVDVSSAWMELASYQLGGDGNSATFKSLTAGYYLVFPEGGGTGNTGVSVGINPEDSRGTDAMLINIPTNQPNATWNIKSTYPTVDKTVEDNNSNTTTDESNGSAQVGDVVTFTLTSKVPDMSDYDTFYFAFNDTLTNGLAVMKNDGSAVADGSTLSIDSLTVTIGGKSVTSGYTVSLENKVLKIEFANLKTAVVQGGSFTAGDEIVVTYKAMITDAAVTTNPALNTVKVEYSNDPNGTGHGTSTPDESKVYTYEINVHKHAQGVESGFLANAVFALSTNGGLGELTQEQINGDSDTIKNQLIPLKDNSSSGSTGKSYVVDPKGTTYTFMTNATDAIKIQGLEAGTYYLYEVTAPGGYNKLKTPIKIQIVVEPIAGNDATADASFENPVYIVTIKGVTTTGTANNSTIMVENKQGIELPETGSMGTIGLTVAGVVVVLVGVFAPRKKKNEQE